MVRSAVIVLALCGLIACDNRAKPPKASSAPSGVDPPVQSSASASDPSLVRPSTDQDGKSTRIHPTEHNGGDQVKPIVTGAK
jgi:hypothetical protein